MIAKSLCFLALLAASVGNAAACDFYVNSNADNDQADGVLTLREALAIANASRFNGDFSNRCRTAAELAQIPGADFLIVPPGPPSPLPAVCSYSEVRYTIVVYDAIGANCGDTIGDNIRFDSNIGVIHATGGFDLGVHDTIDGRQPNGQSVQIVGPGAGSGNGITFGTGDVPGMWNVQISNLSISGFGFDGIHASGCQNASFTNLVLTGNGRHGLFVDGNRCFTSVIGGGDASQRNYIYANGGDGIHIEGLNNNDPTPQNNTVRNNWIGLDGDSDFDASGNGGVGIAVINSRGNTIGGGGANEANAIAKNAGYGLWISGARSVGNRVIGNLIGSAPDFDIASFPNFRGVQIEGGASANTIGDSGSGEANVISGNAHHGVYLTGSGSNANAIQYNIIGLNRARGAAVPNQEDGVAIGGGAQQSSVHDNVISGNASWGIYQGGTASFGTVIKNNVIGLRGGSNSANDNTVAKNGLGGIFLDTTPDNVIGTGNRIAGNGGPGIQVSGEDADRNQILGNSIGFHAGNGAAPNSVGISVRGGADDTVIGSASVANRNVISANTGAGIDVRDTGTMNTLIEGNYIGTSPNGSSDLGNGAEGIVATGIASPTFYSLTVRGNLVSGNANDGIKLDTGSNRALIVGNTVGLNAARNAVVRNDASGISVLGGSNRNTIGGASGSDQNVIGGNGSYGIFIADANSDFNIAQNNLVGGGGIGNTGGVLIVAGSKNNQLVGNRILGNSPNCGIDIRGSGSNGNNAVGNIVGLAAAGTAVANACGVRIDSGAMNNLIGGPNAGDANILSGNTGVGVGIYGNTTQSNLIQGNRIGTDATGNAARPNATGATLQGGAHNNTLSLNLISGNNGDGVLLRDAGTSTNQINRNFIGSNAGFGPGVSNGRDGIRIEAAASGNSIGASAPGELNNIGYNLGAGVNLLDGIANTLRYNRFTRNGGLGIDLGGNGITPNDNGDGDSGPNDLQNFPTLGNVLTGPTGASLTLTLHSTSNANFTLDVYRNYACDTLGNGEADNWEAAFALNTNASGSANLGVVLPFADALTQTSWAVATATGATGNTSEFSPCVAVSDLIFADDFGGVGGNRAALRTATPAQEKPQEPTWPIQGLRVETALLPQADGSTQLLLTLANDGRTTLPPLQWQLVPVNAYAVVAPSLDARCKIGSVTECALPPLAPTQVLQLRMAMFGDVQRGLRANLELRDGTTLVDQRPIQGAMPSR